jgi:hypothetical protein
LWRAVEAAQRAAEVAVAWQQVRNRLLLEQILQLLSVREEIRVLLFGTAGHEEVMV